MSSISPRVLVEPSEAILLNIGDMAMLQVAIRRLSEAFPASAIQVLTWEPAEFRSFCPQVEPLPADARNVWLELLPQKLAHALPIRWSTGLRQIAARALLPLFRKSPGKIGAVAAKISGFLDAVASADVLVVTGMGGITDYFPRAAYEILETVSLALSCGCRVFLVGQGIGPLESGPLRARAAAVLPRAELIGVREKRASVPTLHALGVAPDRIIITGDDALELGCELPPADRGSGIGLNLRIADYAAITTSDATAVANAVREEAHARGAPIVALPVSHPRGDADAQALSALMPELASDLERAGPIRTPAELSRQTRHCRIVVAGSYHAAVFALSMGIPAIGIARSSYYVDKFAGLADMFGDGCTWVDLNDEDALTRLRFAVRRMWEDADVLRGEILARRDMQVRAGRDLYSRIGRSIEGSDRHA